ncbi:hypothetical protein EDD52_111126 [Primorskyibacter sedentarius]|uniref:Uncharacterized protein n=1 Tax=Primorskyibacter sedentarius TaxID=745311 RepID=A0A4R3J6Q8_9RHOB|nr:hypothetical protein EDD52_111126 [Primorskyibacter sedentarius]
MIVQGKFGVPTGGTRDLRPATARLFSKASVTLACLNLCGDALPRVAVKNAGTVAVAGIPRPACQRS